MYECRIGGTGESDEGDEQNRRLHCVSIPSGQDNRRTGKIVTAEARQRKVQKKWYFDRSSTSIGPEV